MSDAGPHNIRRADPSDAEALFDLVLPLWQEESVLPVSAGKLRRAIDRCIQADHAIAGVIDGDSEVPLRAAIGLVIDEDDYSDTPHIRTIWLGAHVKHRRAPHVAHLLEFAKWAQAALQRSAGHPLPLVARILTRVELEGKMMAYQRQLPQVGALFAWGALPDDAFDQVRLTNGRGNRGAPEKGSPDRVSNRASPLRLAARA